MDTPASPRVVEVAIGVVRRDGRLLICQRPEGAVLGGCWEFPGGKVEAGETIEQCLQRELREELDIAVRIDRALPPIDHVYPHAHVRLHPLLCTLETGEPRAIGCRMLKWIDAADLGDYPFPPANDALLAAVAALCAD